MIATLITIGIAFYWMLWETDYLRIRLESTGYQRQHKQLAKADFGNTAFGKEADIPEETTPYTPTEFTLLEMPEVAGTLNILCERG